MRGVQALSKAAPLLLKVKDLPLAQDIADLLLVVLAGGAALKLRGSSNSAFPDSWVRLAVVPRINWRRPCSRVQHAPMFPDLGGGQRDETSALG